MAETKGDSLLENPLLTRLLSAGAAESVSFRGYIGASAKEGHITLYPNLDDLSRSIEIPRKDIIDFAELPDTVLPLGAVIIWVGKSATITERGVAELRDISSPGPVVRTAGRLRMRLRRPVRGGEVCVSRCNTCQSRCLTCNSHCNPE
jgi:hypothetical protein